MSSRTPIKQTTLLFTLLLSTLFIFTATLSLASAAVIPPGFEKAAQAQQLHGERLLQIRGVVGTGLGKGADGEPQLVVYLENPSVTGVPATLDGVPVQARVTGRFYALKNICSGPPDSRPAECFADSTPTIDPTARFDRPVPTGVSTGHPDITAGTIGARVTDGSNVYILSNNHVYANSNNALLGDPVIQPGSYDGGSTSTDTIGNLHDYESLRYDGSDNLMDAAIAASTTADIGNSTPSDGYGTPNQTTTSAQLGQSVHKYGRTTGYTVGSVSELNVIVNVCYEVSGPFCALSARFINQIAISDGNFSDGGDSGSLIVTNDGNNYPLGLLFAGSSTRTLANPIGPVLARFGVTIDGSATPPPVDSGIVLTADGYKVKGLHKVQLNWNSDNSGDVIIYRDNNPIITTADDGDHLDPVDNKGGGSYHYYLCESEDSSSCSNTVQVTF